MKMRIGAYLFTLCTILVFDGIWLSVMGPGFYMQKLKPLLTESPVIPAAGAFYLLYAFGVSYLVVLPAIRVKEVDHGTVAKRGFVLGLVSYGTYDLTNHALLHNWPLVVTVVDMLWGSLYTGAISVIVHSLLRRTLSRTQSAGR